MNAIIIFCILCVLLTAGKLLRLGVPLLQRLYLPSSVVGGIVGLIVISIFRPSSSAFNLSQHQGLFQ